jgi:hypothetical protein
VSVDTTIVVEFGNSVSDDSFVVVELDEESNLDDTGKEITSFAPGEKARFLVHFDPDELKIASVVVSDGDVKSNGAVYRTREEQFSFSNKDDKTLSYIPYGSLTWDKWYGNEATVTNDSRVLKITGDVPAIGEVSYEIWAQKYTLTPPDMTLTDDESYPILCVVTLEDA